MIFTINIYHYNIIISTISVKTSSLFSDTELKCYHVEGKMTAVCYVMWSECEIGDGCRPEGYTMKEVHAVFVFAGLKKKSKTPSGDNRYYYSGFLFSLLSCAFCFRLQARHVTLLHRKSSL